MTWRGPHPVSSCFRLLADIDRKLEKDRPVPPFFTGDNLVIE